MTQSIHLDNYKLIYSTAGQPDAPLLLMVHGWLSYHGVWRQTLQAFQDDYYCVAVDLLGFGDSDKPAHADYSIETQGQRILQLTDALGYDRFTLIGHSLGGQIALCMASMLAPERAIKVVNIGGVVSARLMPAIERVNYKFVALAKVFPQLYSLWRRLFRYDWVIRSVFAEWFHQMDTMPLAHWAEDRRMAFRPDIHISAYRSGQAIHNLDLRPYLVKITAPTLTIFGRQDAVVPLSDGYLAQEHIPNSQLVLIDRCGHFPMYERTEEYLAALRDFLLD